jgi:hypothetical protein
MEKKAAKYGIEKEQGNMGMFILVSIFELTIYLILAFSLMFYILYLMLLMYH